MNPRFLRIAGVAALGGVVVMSACTLTRPITDPTRYYLLASVEFEEEAGRGDEHPAGEPLSVGLRRIQVTDYFNTPAITVRTGENSLRYSEFNRWAESLDRGASRIVREQLRGDPFVGSILLFPEASREEVNYEVEIHLLACEAVEHPDGSGSYSFRAFWMIYDGVERSIESGGEFTRTGDWSRGDYAAFARSISGACSELGREIARQLRELETATREI